MILLWGIHDDPPMELVYEDLQAMGKNVLFLHQPDLIDYETEIMYDKKPMGFLRCGQLRVDIGDIEAMYLRPYDTAHMFENGQGLEKVMMIEHELLSLAELLPGRVVNRPSRMTSNNSKPFQALIIEQAGFRIPETIITTDVEDVLSFKQRHGHIIYKSISGIRSVVKQLTDMKREELVNIKNCPTQFQQFVSGSDYRVHVVGSRVFACKIDSATTDYRYSQNTFQEAYKLPDEVASKCVTLTDTLGLSLSGIDLRRADGGEWYCFEVNTSPGYSYFQANSGLAISKAIAELLSEV